MKKKLRLVTVTFGGLIVATACGGGGESGSGEDSGSGGGESNPSELRILTGSEEGAYFPLGGALANNIINENLEDVSASNFSSGGSVVNIDDVAAGDAHLGFAQNDVAANAAEGTNMYEGEAVEGFSGIATLYPEVIQIVTSADSGIETVSDLEGAAVAVGDQGSGTEINANQIMEAHGITYDDISPEYMDFGDAANNIQDGNIDAAFITGGLPTGAVESLNANTDMNLVSIDEDVREELLNDYSYYTESMIEADTYGLENDAETIAVQATLIANNDLDEDLVYNITEAMYENTDAFADAHQQGNEITEEDAQEGMSIDLHPGAERYFNEQEE